MVTPYLLRPAAPARVLDVFISSGGDATVLRDRFDRLLRDVNQQLYGNVNIVFRPLMWTRVAAQKTYGDTNATFVEMVRRSDLTVVLLINEIRPGTREELEAALDEGEVQLAVLWFPTNEVKATGRRLRQFLKKNEENFLYNAIGPIDEDEAWFGMFRILTRVVIQAVLDAPSEVYYERL